MTEHNHPITFGWLLYRIVEGKPEPEFLGLYQTRDAAEKDVAVMANLGQQWHIESVPFLGWGYVAPGVFSQDGPAPLKLVTKDDDQ